MYIQDYLKLRDYSLEGLTNLWLALPEWSSDKQYVREMLVERVMKMQRERGEIDG